VRRIGGGWRFAHASIKTYMLILSRSTIHRSPVLYGGDLHCHTTDPIQLHENRMQLQLLLGMKTVSEFFGIPEIDFEIFRSDSPVTAFFEKGIGFESG
jgi:hypothetical protein